MAPSKFKTFCRIIDYVEAVDSELADILKGTCTVGSLGTKGKAGVTFLMPVDAATKKKLADLAYSDKPENIQKANDMLNAMIIKEAIKTPQQWLPASKDIPNSLYPSQICQVESVDGPVVKFAGGATAVLSDFKDASRDGNLSVWKLTGALPVTTDKPSKVKYVKKRDVKKGGYDVTAEMSRNVRFKIGLAVENAYMLHKQSGEPRDCFLEHTCSLLHYVINVAKDVTLFHERIAPMMSFDKIDFYLFVEPHKFGGEYLIPDEVISAWYENRHKNTCDPKSVMAQAFALAANGNCACFNDTANVLAAIQQAREELMGRIESSPRAVVDAIDVHYKQLENNNEIGDVSGVYPNGLATYYRQNPGLKMAHDEARYVSHCLFSQLERGQFDQGQFNEIVNFIGELLFAADSETRSKQHKLLNKDTIKIMIFPIEKVSEIKQFINSTCFLHIALGAGSQPGSKSSTTRPEMDKNVIFNIAGAVYARHERLLSNNSESVARLLLSMDKSQLPPNLREELAKKFNA